MSNLTRPTKVHTAVFRDARRSAASFQISPTCEGHQRMVTHPSRPVRTPRASRISCRTSLLLRMVSHSIMFLIALMEYMESVKMVMSYTKHLSLHWVKAARMAESSARLLVGLNYTPSLMWTNDYSANRRLLLKITPSPPFRLAGL